MKALTVILCLGLIAAGCKKLNETAPKTQATIQSEGTITGISRIPCQNLECGGIEITVMSSGQSQNYLIYSSMSALGIMDSTKFPISVNLKWQPDTSPLRGSNYITVSDVSVVNN